VTPENPWLETVMFGRRTGHSRTIDNRILNGTHHIIIGKHL